MVGEGRQRIDKWLFFTRAVKSRSLAAKLVQSGHVRLNREKIDRPAHPVKPGDVLTITLAQRILVWRVLDPGTRRGPAEEARTLYEDLSAPKREAVGGPDMAAAERPQGAGRPTKKDRRATDALRDGE